MTKAIIVHGWDGSPEDALNQWLKKELEKKGWEVQIPEMPDPEEPTIEEWVNKLYDYSIDENTYFIGHSIGCQAIMRYLDRVDGKIGGLIFIAPWTHLNGLEKEQGAEEIAAPWLESAIDFDRVKEKTNKIVCIFSDDDYHVPLSEKEVFELMLDAETVVLKKKGHFTKEDGVKELPIVLEKLGVV
jgi:hypothetical protein